MQRIIRLRDFSEYTTEQLEAEYRQLVSSHVSYKLDIIDRARKVMESRDIRFNVSTGATRDNHLGSLGQYVGYSEHRPTVEKLSDLEVCLWELWPFVRNSASRISSGYAA